MTIESTGVSGLRRLPDARQDTDEPSGREDLVSDVRDDIRAAHLSVARFALAWALAWALALASQRPQRPADQCGYH